MDPLFFIIFVVGFFFTGMLSLYIWGQISGEVSTALVTAGANPTINSQIFTGLNIGKTAFANMITFVIFVVMFLGLSLSYLVKVNPVFLFFSLIMLVMTIIVAVIGHDLIFTALNAVPDLANQIPNTLWFWNNITIIMAIYGVMNIVLLYYNFFRGSRG